jgi:hypothetical protein
VSSGKLEDKVSGVQDQAPADLEQVLLEASGGQARGSARDHAVPVYVLVVRARPIAN